MLINFQIELAFRAVTGMEWRNGAVGLEVSPEAVDPDRMYSFGDFCIVTAFFQQKVERTSFFRRFMGNVMSLFRIPRRFWAYQTPPLQPQRSLSGSDSVMIRDVFLGGTNETKWREESAIPFLRFVFLLLFYKIYFVLFL